MSCTTRPDPADDCCTITVCTPDDTVTTTEPEPTLGVRPRSGAARLQETPQLRVTELKPLSDDETELKLLISDAILDSILSSETRPLLVEWRYGGDTRWRSAEVGVDDFSVESLDTLVMKVTGLRDPRRASVRVSYAGETSPVVRGEDLVPEGATLPPPPEAETTTEGGSHGLHG